MRKKFLVVLAVAFAAAGFMLWKKGVVDPLPTLLPALEDNGEEQPVALNLKKGDTPGPLTISGDFGMSVFAEKLGGPRDLVLDPKGVLLVSVPSTGKIVAMPDQNRDGVADQGVEVVTGLDRPHGLLFYKDKLYVAEEGSVSTYTYNTETHKATNRKRIISLPTGGNHTSRSIHLEENSDPPKLLVSTGSSCNVCEEDDDRRAAVYSSNMDGSDFKAYSTGLRNSVFLTTNPVDGKIWATDMGRDYLGDNLPPDEVNVLERGKNFGWPICYGQGVHDTNFDKKQYLLDPCRTTMNPRIEIPAHSAPLGLAFVPEEGWPEDMALDLLVAYHGSWNRSVPTGYKVVQWNLDQQGNPSGSEDFISGFSTGGSVQAYGRPVDILLLPGGRGYISDDKGGRIFLLQRVASE